MTIEDPLLPAAAHLTGPAASDVLRPVISAAGGELLSCRTSHVQYRPESDLVVRYRCEIRRSGVDVTDTLLAATTIAGPHVGTLPVEAETPDGRALSVGVWRWPFDPVLVDLATMVTPHLANAHLHDLVGGDAVLEVVAYRPTERAVIRARGDGREIYVKIVPPALTAALARRHILLADAGLPVPRVLATGSGWIAMEALVGTTLRDRLKNGVDRLPSPDRYRELLHVLGDIDLGDVTPTRSRLADAPHHAAMLGAVLPGASGRLDAIVERLSEDSSWRTHTGTVHGDLHEAQLVVDDRTVTGLLDIDDVGPGDPLDDVGALVAHLRFRAMTSGDQRIEAYATAVRQALSANHDDSDVDRHIAAVLVGLATGPFRIQQPDWAATTERVLELIEHHLTAAATAIGAPTG
ncbi:MAG TPA: aminoglycoside phosphotransferase family protein [Ilumatobacteraceae bacterium]|nr:aminoglycoside phosphotransferase family protein [Ilumatobacteraceae bacterium]